MTTAKRAAEVYCHEIVTLMRESQKTGNYDEVYDLPIEVAVRSAWQRAGEQLVPAEYSILLCTGGPAVRVYGRLDDAGRADSAEIEYQDWGTLWTSLTPLSDDEAIALLRFAQVFFDGDL